MSEYYFGGIIALMTMIAFAGLASYYAYTIATDKT